MKKLILSFLFIVCALTTYAYDWKTVSLSGGVELMANYSWRGFEQGGVACQPQVEFSSYGITIGAFASVSSGVYSDFCQFNPEIDIYLSYTAPSDWFTILFTHYYYFEKSNFINFAYGINLAEDPQSQTEFELTIRPLKFLEENNGLEIGAAIQIGGGDYWSGNGEIFYKDAQTYEQLFSTYIYLRYIYENDNWEVIPEFGFSPHKSMYTYVDPVTGKAECFALNNLSLLTNYTFFDNDLIALYAFASIRFNFYDVGCEQFAYGKNFGWNVGLGFEL